jgi:endonuclease YncB( thermonuclease family)
MNIKILITLPNTAYLVREQKFMKTIKVKRIIDGDDFEGEDGINYRLRSVYAPESNEPGFKKCWQALEELILGKELEIISEQPAQSHNRPVVEVMVVGEGDSINKKMNIFINKL